MMFPQQLEPQTPNLTQIPELPATKTRRPLRLRHRSILQRRHLPIRAHRRPRQQRRLRARGRLRGADRRADQDADGRELLRPDSVHAQSHERDARPVAAGRADPAGDVDRRAAGRSAVQHLLREQVGRGGVYGGLEPRGQARMGD